MPPHSSRYTAKSFQVRLRPKTKDKPARAGRTDGGPAGRAGDTASSSSLSRTLTQTFLDNSLGGGTIQQLAHAGEAAGARGVGGLASAGGHGQHPGNIARDIRRQLIRLGNIPKSETFYWADLPLWDVGQERCLLHKIPVLLPHELLPVLLKNIPPRAAVPNSGTPGFSRFNHLCESLGLPLDTTIPLAIWGDGVPYTKKGSLIVVNLSVAGLPGSPRVPLLALPSKYLCKCGGCQGRHTLDVFWDIVAWSFRFLALGVTPQCRHDQQPWEEYDQHRAALGNTVLAQRGLMFQVKGDWEFLASKLGLPSWAEVNICWWCAAQKDSFSTLTAENMHALRRTSPAFFAQLRRDGKAPCPLFSVPGVTTESVVVDWMHCVDLGVGQDIVGGAIWTILGHYEGRTRAQKLTALFRRLQSFYVRTHTPSRIDALTLGMVKVVGRPAKLKSKAHECRCLVPFVAEEVLRWRGLHTGDAVLNLLHQAVDSLQQLGHLAAEEEWQATPAEHLLSSLGGAWNALAEVSPDVFRVKPKLHMLQHLVLHVAPLHGSPARYWNYLDEDWGGRLVKLAKHRGGGGRRGAGREACTGAVLRSALSEKEVSMEV